MSAVEEAVHVRLTATDKRAGTRDAGLAAGAARAAPNRSLMLIGARVGDISAGAG